MPLMPAMRPLSAIISAAATPISTPPSVEAIGVNSVTVMARRHWHFAMQQRGRVKRPLQRFNVNLARTPLKYALQAEMSFQTYAAS
jgi:hypothetical protein